MILNRITSRDLYKTVDYKVFPWQWKGHLCKFFNPGAIVVAAKSHNPKNDAERAIVDELSTQHIIIDEAVLHYGMGENNPIDKVRFYSKRKPHGTRSPYFQINLSDHIHISECYKAEPGDISSLMPATFGEVLLRIYTRDVRFFGLIQHGYRLVLQDLPQFPTSSSNHPSTPTKAGAVSPLRSSGGRVFSNNSFTTVEPGYAPPSPTAEHAKRRREGSSVLSPRKKLRSV